MLTTCAFASQARLGLRDVKRASFGDKVVADAPAPAPQPSPPVVPESSRPVGSGQQTPTVSPQAVWALDDDYLRGSAVKDAAPSMRRKKRGKGKAERVAL